MSYVKKCNVCGQRISLREMQNGQWVAFDVNTDSVHKHGKRSKVKNLDLQSDSYSNEKANDFSSDPNKPNYGIFFLIGIIILGIWMFS